MFLIAVNPWLFHRYLEVIFSGLSPYDFFFFSKIKTRSINNLSSLEGGKL